MGVGAGLYMYDVVVKKFTFAISSLDDEFLLRYWRYINHLLTYLHQLLTGRLEQRLGNWQGRPT